MSAIPRLRCAIYTRKSSEDGLEQEFNSLDAQREACAAFIASQVGLGWKLIADRYDDGGISGGTMERPALKRLLSDITARRVDVVVVYKIDRLTRSLADFARIVEVFDDNSVSFVSVTQQFNTTSSMGRLTLNVLLSFAQFEREVTAERIRDKIAASKAKGIWMGGTVPLGYRVENRKLLIKEPEASFVRGLFTRYLEFRSVPKLSAEVTKAADRARQLQPTSPRDTYTRRVGTGMLYKVLANPIYIGRLKHRQNVYDGEHEAIVDAGLFERAQHLLAAQASTPRGSQAHADAHLLTGMLLDDTGDRMGPSHANARGIRYLYYISSRIKNTRRVDKTAWRVPARELDAVVLRSMANLLSDRSRLVDWTNACAPDAGIGQCLDRAAELRQKLIGATSTEQRTLLHEMLQSVTLDVNELTLAVNVTKLMAMLVRGQTAREVPAETDSHPASSVSVVVPITIRRRGNEMRLIVPGDNQSRGPDPQLVNLIARAHLYLEHLNREPATTVSDVAKHFGVHRVDVGRILPLAFLAPRITAQILGGNQSDAITARKLARDDLPILWSGQLATLS